MVVDVLDVGGVVGGGYEIEAPAVRKLDGLPPPLSSTNSDAVAIVWQTFAARPAARAIAYVPK